MRYHIMRIGLVAFCFAFNVPAAVSAEAIPKPEWTEVDGLVSWVYDYEEGKEKSRLSGKPMFVVFRCER